METTLVSCVVYLPELQEKKSFKTFEFYKKSCLETFKINKPFVIFCEKEFYDEIYKIREGKPTELIIVNKENLYYNFCLEHVRKFLKEDENYTYNHMTYKAYYEIPRYCLIVLSKIKYLEDVVKRNPFNTKYFMWIDASISRFFGDLEISELFPNTKKLEDGKLNIQSSLTRLKNVVKNRSDQFLMKQISHDFNAYLFGGTGNVIEFFSNKQDEVVDSMLENKVINTEEVAFSIIYKEHSDKFEIHNFGVGRPQEIQFLKYLNI